MKTIGPKELAELLHKSVPSITCDATRNPGVLPPRIIIEGSRALLWLESDVISWIDEARKKGREHCKKAPTKKESKK